MSFLSLTLLLSLPLIQSATVFKNDVTVTGGLTADTADFNTLDIQGLCTIAGMGSAEFMVVDVVDT
jgi:hypothetical protein